jgi:hypothetical protein
MLILLSSQKIARNRLFRRRRRSRKGARRLATAGILMTLPDTAAGGAVQDPARDRPMLFGSDR